MDSSIASSAYVSATKFRCFDPSNSSSAMSRTRNFSASSLASANPTSAMRTSRSSTDFATEKDQPKIVPGVAGYVLEDVPHLTDYISDLSVYFETDDVHACIVTCGGLCPGLNTVIREIICGLNHMYGVKQVLGIEGGYRGFYARNTIPLTPKVVNDIHKRGGTILGTSRGGHDTSKIVDSIQDRGINQVIDKSFGFDTAVEEAQRAINAAHVEAESVENGVGVVKLMGRYSGFIAMYATLASRDVDCCLIPESPFYLEGEGGLFEFMEKTA
ncbi:hypothetical protein Scep_008135 [Stephania cephalantha]|uniref:Phosphofructokinase domain-containing protein n=1 Tax=Stephania cephalantha TaxID=152367 RepID=A0AAP0PLS4_9MAGN